MGIEKENKTDQPNAAREKAIAESRYDEVRDAVQLLSFTEGYDAALARTCKWTPTQEGDYPVWYSECDESGFLVPEDAEKVKFCGNCGGKVVELANEK